MNRRGDISGFVLRFLRWFCPSELFEGIEGDLMEQFEVDTARRGKRYAKFRLAWSVLRLVHPAIILRNRVQMRILNTIMINNYAKVTWRNMQKRKLYTMINGVGLSIALAFCILIYLYVNDENSFDQFHTNKENIYRIDTHSYNYWDPSGDESQYDHHAYCQLGLRDIVKDEIPLIDYATRFSPDWKGIVQYEDQVFTERLTFVDADFFKMFSFNLKAANKDKLFTTDGEVVITEDAVKKYFGNEDPLGKSLGIDTHGEGSKSFIIAGICENPPANSSLDFEVLLPIRNRPYYDRQVDRLGNFNTPLFVQLKPAATSALLEEQMAKVATTHMGEIMSNWRKQGNVDPEIEVFRYGTTALADVHLNKQIDWHKVSDPQYTYILGGIAVLILLIACINYISLALTSSAARRTEVGVRKVMGAFRSQIVSQFGFEALALVGLSFIASLGLFYLAIPYFNNFTNKAISVSTGNFVTIFVGGLFLVATVGLIAGSYPSLQLSGFKPVIVLKNQYGTRVKAGFAVPLVILQFALSAFLIVSAMIMYRQMQFITTKDLGFNGDQILVIPTHAGWSDASEKVVHQFRNRVAQESKVVSVSGTSSSFNRGWSKSGYTIDGVNRSAFVYAVDPYYVPLLKMELVEGRNFDMNIPSDTNAIIVNEALVKDMGWTDPLSQYLNYAEDSTSLGAKVIGVVKDYHYRSLEAAIEPMFLSMDTENIGHLATLLVKISDDDIASTIEMLHRTWKELYPDKPFDYSFLDQDVANQYESHRRWMSIMGLSTFFAILISCLGLFGLAGINATNRIKEIGIRKVMGAEVSNIFLMMNKQFVVLSAIAFVIAIPFSSFAMNGWLSKFQFRVQMDISVFVVAICAGTLIALTTVSYHALRAAYTNPVDTLKHE